MNNLKISIRVTLDEREQIEHLAQTVGLSLSDYLRTTALFRFVTPQSPLQVLHLKAGEVNTLSQLILKRCHPQADAENVNDLNDLVKTNLEMISLLKELLVSINVGKAR